MRFIAHDWVSNAVPSEVFVQYSSQLVANRYFKVSRCKRFRIKVLRCFARPGHTLQFALILKSVLPRFEIQPILRKEEVRLELRASRGRASGLADTPPPNPRSLPISNCVQSGTRWNRFPRLAGCAHPGQTSSGMKAGILLRTCSQ